MHMDSRNDLNIFNMDVVLCATPRAEDRDIMNIFVPLSSGGGRSAPVREALLGATAVIVAVQVLLTSAIILVGPPP